MDLCFISCNIRFDNPADGPNNWGHRKKLLSKILLNHQPDIIATQEGRFDQLKELEEYLTGFKLIDHHRSWINDRMYPSLYVREDKLEILTGQDTWLSTTPQVPGSSSFDSAFPRLMTSAIVRVKNQGGEFLLINTHLDHIKQETRINQIQVLINEVKKFWNKEQALIILGDFNDSPDSKVRNLIHRNFPDLIDPWKKLGNLEETSHHAFKGEIQNGSRIDWILIDKSLKLINCTMDKSHENGLYPTDHFPIICQIKI
ncbi:MAG: endonuclease/exonuclease/phosphatase family protein [Bacteriovoracaceae bacterium]